MRVNTQKSKRIRIKEERKRNTVSGIRGMREWENSISVTIFSPYFPGVCCAVCS
jgi:hypothetical protein